MTSLQITPKWKDKTARFKGTIAAGEHVAVSIANDDNYITDTTNLRLRVVNPANGKTLAQFPMPVEVLPLDALEDDGTSEAEETWDSDLTPLQCTLDLNTDRMLMAVPPAANVPLLFVLDAYEGATDEDEGEFTLYFKDMYEVTHWPRRVGEDEPTRLDDYKDLIEDFRERIDAAEDSIRDAVDEANGIVAHVDAAKTDAQNSATAAGNSASAAQASAAAAKDWATGGGETGDPGAENNAKYYAQQAGASATSAETAQGKAEDAQASAEAAQTAAETAQGKAEDAQEAAETAQAGAESAAASAVAEVAGDLEAEVTRATAAEEAMASQISSLSSGKADKSTTLAGYGITDAVKTVNGNAPDENGNVNVEAASIPIATADRLGGVKVGSGLSVAQDGTLSATHDATKLDKSGGTMTGNLVVQADNAAIRVVNTDSPTSPYTEMQDGKIIRGNENAQTAEIALPNASGTLALLADLAAKATKADIAPEFDAEAYYYSGDLVYYNGALYRCSTEHQGAWNASHFVADADVSGSLGLIRTDVLYNMQMKANIADISTGYYTPEGGPYAVGDIVFKMGEDGEHHLFRCTSAGPGAGTGAAEWESVTVEELIAEKQDALSAAQLANIAAVPSKADAADLRYALVTKTIADDAVTLDDRAVNEVVVPTPASGATEVTLTLNLPAAVSGKARDLLVRLDLTNVPTTGIDISGISFAPASDETATFETDGSSWPENKAGAVNLWSFTETTAGTWAVARKTLTAVTQGGAS